MEVVSAFNVYAHLYHEWYHKTRGSLIFKSELKAVDALKFEGLGVEVGVGTGIFASKLGISLGVDPAINMIKITKSKGVNVVQAVGEFLPIRSGYLDYVLIVFTICFFKDPQSALREAWRILRRGGNAIVGFIPRKSERSKLYLKKKAEGHKLWQHAEFYSVKKVKEILEKEGFKTTKVSATLSQQPKNIRKVEEPSGDVRDNVKLHHNRHIDHNILFFGGVVSSPISSRLLESFPVARRATELVLLSNCTLSLNLFGKYFTTHRWLIPVSSAIL